MGLIDDLRKKRDPWIGRLEEQRQDDYGKSDDQEDKISGLTEQEIMRNREMVGKFEKRN